MPKKQTKVCPTAVDKDQDQWVMFLPESLSKSDGDSSPRMCKLRHPKTDEGAMFLFGSENHHIFEVLRFNEKYRSWFIEDTVQSDGSIVLPAPVDPIFLALPYLIKSAKSGKFMQLEQIIEDEEFPECNRLCSCQDLNQLSHVCQSKGADDVKVFRFDKDKTLAWLQTKVERLSTVLTEKKIHTSITGSCSSSYVKSIKSTGDSSEDTLRYAHGMVSEYLSPSLSKDLQDHLSIKDVVIHEKPEIEEPKAKRSKKDITPTEDYSKQNGDSDSKKTEKNTRTTLAQKKLEKVDKAGMKNISSFFSPKSKK